MFAEDLDVFFSDDGVQCVVPGHDPVLVLPWSPDMVNNFGDQSVVAGDESALMKSSDVAGLGIKNETGLSIAGRSFKVIQVLRVDDGAFSRLVLCAVRS